MRSALVAVVLGLAIAVGIVACGAGAKKESAFRPRAQDASPLSPGGRATPRDEIIQLDQEISTNLAEMKEPEPAVVPGGPPDLRPLATIKSVCAPPSAPTGTCGDVCTLSNRICEAAEKICGLAQNLAPDPWAAEKCDKGKKSCEAATRRCCRC